MILTYFIFRGRLTFKVKDRGKFSERINSKLSEEFNGILKVFSQNIGDMSGNKIKKTKPSNFQCTVNGSSSMRDIVALRSVNPNLSVELQIWSYFLKVLRLLLPASHKSCHIHYCG